MMVKNIIRKIAGIITAIATISVYMVTAPINGYAEKSTNNGPIIVSLGDSYSSGEGIEPFIGQNEKISVRVNNPNWLAHRSEKAWSGMLTLPSISGKMSDHLGENWFFVAASGALTSHMLNQFPKKAIKDIYRNDKTTALDPQLNVFKQLGGKKADYVTLTLGGNDAGFTDVITKCVTHGCVTDSFPVNYIMPSNLSDQLNNTWKDFFEEGGIRDSLYTAYKDIETRAGSQAKIIVAGYPQLLNPDGGFMISKEEAILVNENVSKFNKAIESIVKNCRSQGMQISFVSVEKAFEGHAAYSSDPFINEVCYLLNPQDLNDYQFPPVSAYSMHPNEKGAIAYAECVQKTLNELEDVSNGIYSDDISVAVYNTNDELYDNYTIEISGKEFKGLLKTGIINKSYTKTVAVNTAKEMPIRLPKGDYTVTLIDNFDNSIFYSREIKVREGSKNNRLLIKTMLGTTISQGDLDDNSKKAPSVTENIPIDAGFYKGHYYYLFTGGVASSYEEARQYCIYKGGYLATITSKEENDFLYTYITNLGVENAYFGLSDSENEGKWEWCNGESSSYTNWHTDEPNGEAASEDYAMFYEQFTDGTWNDGDFGELTDNGGNAFICEWGDYSTKESQTNERGNLSEDRNVILTLDVSGSMDGTPLDETKKASNNFINTILKEDANIGIVTYADTSEIATGLSNEKTNLQEIVTNLYANGGTNIEAGLRDARWMLEKNSAQKKIIVLMSDGEPNEGLEGEDLIAYADAIKKEGIRIYTIGFFDSLEDKSYAQYLMEHIASDGCHYEVANADDLVFFFGDMADQINGQKYIYIRIACPVDVSVTYNGETLNSSEEDMNARTSFGTLTFEESKDEFGENVDERVKVLRLKEGTDYDLNLTGTGHGIMNYTIGFMDDNGEYSDLRRFEKVKITSKTNIDTVASAGGDSILNIDQNGDGKYDLRLQAEPNGYAEEIRSFNMIRYIVIGAGVLLIADLLALILFLRSRRKGR